MPTTRLSPAAVERLREHVEAAHGTADTKEDRQLASDLAVLFAFYLNATENETK